MIDTGRFEGLVAAPFTPMDKQGNIEYDMIGTYYDFLENNGVIGAFINGTTGEGPSLTQKEKQRQAEKWAERLKAGGKVRIINLVGGTSYRECIENAIHSKECGLSAIAILAPYYFKPACPGLLAEFCTRIGESVPGMPVYFYHIPVLTGVNVPMYGFLERISEMLPNFAGIKYTHEDLMDFMKCLNYKGGRYDMLWGRDECLLAALVTGCRGAVGSTYNYAAPLYLKLIEAFNAGNLNEARRLQHLSVRMIDLLGKYGGMAVGKAFMKYTGLDCGACRLPVTNMQEGRYAAFVEDVRSLGIDKLFSKL
ncbi:MAG: dihydrodipicolinate synthase family protein [Bacteroidales bacterium]|nr:dihydrodipicolinate synthase family protein [Bacteroidales bacterium]